MTHLHLHSTYSILDAISKIPDIVKRAVEYGHKSLALTDHGTIAGVPEFYRECKKQGIKPIPACEFYHVEDHEQDKINAKESKRRGSRNHHLILLAMNEEGWKNIKILTTKSADKFYYAPRIDYSDLEEYSNGLICLTACLKGVVPHNIAEGNYEEAARHAKKLKSLFGDRFYLEAQDGGLDIQPTINEAIRHLSNRLDIPVVGCVDAHYIDRNDVEAHEAIWAIRTTDKIDRPAQHEGGSRVYYSTKEYWLKDYEHIFREMLTTPNGEQRKTTLLEAEIERTLEIADRVGDVSIESTMHLPRYEFIPEGGCAKAEDSCNHNHPIEVRGEVVDNESFNYLVELVREGYEVKYGRPFFDASEEHRGRLQKELTDIKDAKLADYFLIIWDIVRWSKKNDIFVGPGRGSAAGCMVSYCLDITGIEPLRYGLIWERFFNRGRIGSLADIDLDFPQTRREDVIKYIKERFGEDRVAQMVTYNTLAPKAALKDTNRIMGKTSMSNDDANLMTRQVPDKVKNIQDAIEKSEKLKEYSETHPRLFKIAKTLEGCAKSSGKHAAGVIISDKPFSEGSVPLRWDTKKKMPITAWDGDTLSDLGYLKVDILGLKTMDVLHSVATDINRRIQDGNG